MDQQCDQIKDHMATERLHDYMQTQVMDLNKDESGDTSLINSSKKVTSPNTVAATPNKNFSKKNSIISRRTMNDFSSSKNDDLDSML